MMVHRDLGVPWHAVEVQRSMLGYYKRDNWHCSVHEQTTILTAPGTLGSETDSELEIEGAGHAGCAFSPV